MDINESATFLWIPMRALSINMPLWARIGPVFGQCCTHQVNAGPVQAYYSIFTETATELFVFVCVCGVGVGGGGKNTHS